MSITTVTHLNFRGRAREALAFYASAFDGSTTLVTYADAGNVRTEEDRDLIMWGQTVAANGFAVMAYDVPTDLTFDRGDRSFFVSIRGDDEEELTDYWEGLSQGATVVQNLAPSGWTPLYGMLTDQFGVTWVLDIAVAYDAG